VGNQAVLAALRDPSPPGRQPVLQRKLIPLDAQLKPGRLPDNEAVSLVELLKSNGYSLDDRKKARSQDTDKSDLESRFQRVLAIEARFSGSNINPGKRRELRAALANEYDQLLDAAERYRDDANDAYETAVDGFVAQIRTANPVERLYKGNGPWKDTWKNAIDDASIGVRILKFSDSESFREEVFKRYNAKFRPGGQSTAPAPWTPAEETNLQDEKDRVNAQLQAWQTIANNAQGCNINGTWGTSAGGAGANFAATHLTERVWAKLRKWWRSKGGAYITPSETTTWSLKMYRDNAGNLSPTFNYHAYVP
jgi:hypothetical protein